MDFWSCEHLPLGDEYKQLTSDIFYTHPELIENYSRIPDKIIEKFLKNEPA
ncbi:MAG: hypothetical protein K2L64_02990 [Ureaplasma sp.]|nr:hypothetical protein [Ureaplasma sp.]